MRIVFFLMIFIFSGLSFSQGHSDLMTVENELSQLAVQLRQTQEDVQKIEISKKIIGKLKTSLNSKEAFDYPFSKVKTIGFITSPDKKIRIVNWNIEKEDFSNQYFCLIFRYDDRKKEYISYELNDDGDPYAVIPEDYVDGSQWYGALYYKIIPIEKNNKTIYTVLGYDAKNKTSHIKLIDAITFSGTKVKLGSPIFYNKKKVQKRVIMEHSKKSVMSLKYDEGRGKIVFDHLSPENPIMAEFREFYVPDMSYDSYNFENGRWELHEDIVATNTEKGEKQPALKVYDMNKKGEMVSSTQKNVWIDPTDKNAPAGSNIHTPALPDAVEKTKKQKNNQPANMEQYQFPKTSKKKNVPSSYEVILKNKNKKKKK
ncbi:MAG: hypothetical protein J0G96_13195 [Flavobacteriia bacterium]|nr:hypothetical protein [Flavobacteriia bacterium]OJX39358.1 MAG: hypothetical protein BGO87_05125 [Flavobacteriia bacterium 40-80]